MGRKEKTLAAMEANPGGWRYDEVASVLQAFGFAVRKGKGSHRAFSHPGGGTVMLVEKGHGALKPYQVEEAARAIRNRTEEI
ncbi:MAG: type II toxin-antitoxin system HicA family toxin [Gemmatimonadetes bacterium]|nr:type II toxin-antitoxin system HicA family toxin [Gemmatimonadota bacterium]